MCFVCFAIIFHSLTPALSPSLSLYLQFRRQSQPQVHLSDDHAHRRRAEQSSAHSSRKGAKAQAETKWRRSLRNRWLATN